MRLTLLLASAVAFAALASPALAWTAEDHEIFDLVSALEAAEGKGTNFYSYLNVTKSVEEKALNKAIRKRSLELHPDKNPNDKKVADRFARLGVIAEILRDAEKRKRYDHFYENGVPRWRGTGYYYSRYRPGLGAVVAGLTVFSIFVHYVFLYLSYRLSKMRITAFRTQALEAAWGPTKKPQQGKKKLKVKTSEQGDPLGMPGVNDGKPTPPGSTIELVVEGDNVFIVENRKENLLTEDLAVKPALRDTWLPRLVLERLGYSPSTTSSSAAKKSSGPKKVFRKPTVSADEAGATSGEEVTSGGEEGGKKQGKGIEGMGKVGGRRRKTVPRPSAAKKDA
ncbi:DnaJ family protein [Rhodotorula toruloides]|uniref:DnaJ family protein n=1 Tax=Rhodotorula toruloides TaxID=5286 RepID=A0A511KH62_RHOTO|nr:DnaJ family protein [Rhodotorula toruloides]